jgi:methylated-DNA-[protein]-cysteine S-methyltransferase
MSALGYRLIETRLGTMAIVGSSAGLRRVILPQKSARAATQAVGEAEPTATADPALLPEVADKLRAYFTGERVTFRVRLDAPDSTPFTASVWDACRAVAYGKTATYAELARRVGRPGAARAVGMAMARNPLPIVVPCHRVLRSDGGLGGYSGPGGVGFKQVLLEMEQGHV